MNHIVPRILIAAVALAPAVFADEPAPLPPSTAEYNQGGKAPESPVGRPGPTPERREFRRRPEPEAMETVAFLGIAAEPVSPTLVAQLSLPRGTGLAVRHVMPDGPAAAVLQAHDVLLRLDDQILINEHQLATLVRLHREGDEVTLTYVRAGKQATARVKLSKHDVPKMSDVLRRVGPLGFGAALHGPGGDREGVDRVLSLINRAHPGEPARIELDRRGPGTSVRGTRVFPGKSSIRFSDDAGSLELTMNDGEKTLVAKDAKGNPQFSGPVTTPEQREAMPAAVRERLERLESMHDVTFRTDGDFKHVETRVFEPQGERIRFQQQGPRGGLPDPRTI